MFKLSFADASRGQSHTLQANDEHDKRQWVTSLLHAQRLHGNQQLADDYAPVSAATSPAAEDSDEA